MKRKLSFILALVLCISLIVSGCAKDADKNATEKEEASSIVTPAGQLPIVKDKVTLKVFMTQAPAVENFETNAYTKYLEDKTNIHIEWILTPGKDAKSKVNLILASNSDLPDVFLNPGVDRDMLVEYGQQGIIVPLNQYIEKYGVEIKKIQAVYPNLLNDITTPDGNIYSLFNKNEALNLQYRSRLWMNKTFLDKLNLKVPTTTDELYTVLKAFKEKDPNGNGKADEVPLTGALGSDYEKVDSFIMNAFVYNSTSPARLMIKNGKVEASYNKPEWKKGVLYYKKLADEGLLDPLSFTQDQTQLKQLVNNKNAMVAGTIMAENTNRFAGASSERIKDYIVVPPLKGPDGFQAANFTPNQAGAGIFAVTRECKYPEVAFRLGDFMLSEEASLFARFGIAEKDWVKAQPGEMGANGQQGLIKPILPWGSTQNSNWAAVGFYYLPEKYQSGMVVDKNNPFDFETVLYNAAKSYAPFAWKEPFPALFFTAGEAAEVATLRTPILTYVEETFAKMVLKKDVDVEKEWEPYLKELQKLNIDKYLQMNQKAYDRQYKGKNSILR